MQQFGLVANGETFWQSLHAWSPMRPIRFSTTWAVLTLACLFLAPSLVQAQCVQPTGYQFTKAFMSDAYRLFWTLNTTDDTINIAIASKTDGWVSHGVSTGTNPQMVGAEAVIATAGQAPSFRSYRMNAKDSSLFSPIDHLVPVTRTFSCEYTEGGTKWTVAQFTRSMGSGQNPLSSSGYTPMVLAYGPSDNLVQHNSNARETVMLNLKTGEALGPSPEAKATDRLKIVHGALMFAGFGVFIPVGMIIARYGKDDLGDAWLVLHILFQVFGYAIGFIAFIISLTMVKGDHFKTKVHSQLGLAVMVAAVLQIALGFFRPHTAPKAALKSTIRLIWEFIHLWFGRLITILMVVTIFFGLYQYAAKVGFYIGYAVVVGVILLLILALEIRFRILNHRSASDRKALAKEADNEDDL